MTNPAGVIEAILSKVKNTSQYTCVSDRVFTILVLARLKTQGHFQYLVVIIKNSGKTISCWYQSTEASIEYSARN